jgi:predicted anti-sigma-YlaC factor YlaD
MQCLEVENILIDGIPEQSTAIRVQVRAHLEHCPQCRRLSEDLHKLHHKARSLAAISAPEAMAGSVFKRCRSQLRLGIQPFPARVPIWILTCAGLLFVLTVLWAYPVLKNLVARENVSYSTALAITLLVQNMIMLLCAPLIIQKFRDRAQRSPDTLTYALRRH